MYYLAILLLLIGSFTLAPSVHAEPTEAAASSDTPDIPKPLKVLPSKIKPITTGTDELSKAAPETSGTASPADGHDHTELETLSPRENFGFSPDFWAGATRQDVIAFLKTPYHISSSRSVRDLNLRVTLTPAPALAQNSTSATTVTDNLYALRLKKLVALGDYDDAQKLYKMNESAPPTPLAAQAGIEAMLGHGEIAVACLEQNALPPEMKTDSPVFWKNLDLFCKALLQPSSSSISEKGKSKDNQNDSRLTNAAQIYLSSLSLPSPRTADDINALDPISTIAFLKTGALHDSLQSPPVLSALTDHQLGVIMAYAPPTAETVPALAESLRRGVISDTAALNLLKFMAKTADKTNPVTPFLKEYFKTETPLLTAKLLELADTPIKAALLIPLYTQSNPIFPEGYKFRSIALLSMANQTIPLALAQGALQLGESKAESGEHLIIQTLLDRNRPRLDTDKNAIYAVALALQSAIYPQKDAKNVYENIFSLTPPDNYVMPKGDILSSLKKSADQKQIYQVVIESLSIINDIPPEKLHPASLYRVLEALNSAGFNEETLSLTRDVLRMVLEK